jgi:hypothetical protein
MKFLVTPLSGLYSSIFKVDTYSSLPDKWAPDGDAASAAVSGGQVSRSL